MNSRPRSSRRDFLTGRSGLEEIRARGEAVADALTALIPRARDTIRLETRAMACPWAVVMNPGPPRQVMSASDALDLVHAVEDELTIYRSDTLTSRVNATAADTPQPVTPSLFDLLRECQQLWEETSGAFDPAAGGLIQLWKQARLANTIPAAKEIADLVARSGMKQVRLDAESLSVSFATHGPLFDFGAIGKGHAVDLASAHLIQEGVEQHLVHGGYSSLYALGTHGEHPGWPVGLRNPLVEGAAYATVLLRDQGLGTSGANVQFFRHEGKRYGHILDPRTGWPADSLLSVTVIAATAARADALSTAFYVMGLDNALAYCENHPDVGAIFVPHPEQGRRLQPVIHNIPDDRLFWEEMGSAGTRSE